MRISTNCKIVGVGFHRTGTKTLARCLQEYFGLRHMTVNIEALEAVRVDDQATISRMLATHDSFEDWPWPFLYKYIDKNYPESKFILTLRESPEVWFRSLCQLAKKTGPSDIRKLIYGYSLPEENREAHISRYEQHNREVIDYFRDRPDKLLVVCWEKGDGWPELCSFLGVEQPDKPFPRVNVVSGNR